MWIETLESHMLVWHPLEWDWPLEMSPSALVLWFLLVSHSIRSLGEVKVNSCTETSLSEIRACPGWELILSPPVPGVLRAAGDRSSLGGRVWDTRLEFVFPVVSRYLGRN